MGLLTPPPSFDESSDSFFSEVPDTTNTNNSLDNNRNPSPTKLHRMRAPYQPGGLYNGTGNLQLLPAAAQHPLKSRESSPEHQFQRQSEQPVRTLSPIPQLPHTPIMDYSSSSPPASTAPSPDNSHTPPTTVVSSPPRSVTGWGSVANHRRRPSERGASYAPSPAPSNLSFEVLSGYRSISPAEKVRQHQRDLFYQHRQQQNEREYLWEHEVSPPTEDPPNLGEFRPNADLPFPISEGLRRFYPHAQTHDGFPLAEPEGRRPSAPTEFFERFNTLANTAKQRFGGTGRPAYLTEQMMEEVDDDGPPYSSAIQEHRRVPSGRHSLEDSEYSRATSGIPSYTREFGAGWRDPNPLPTDSAHSTASSVWRGVHPETSAQPTSPVVTTASSKKDDTLLSAYGRELKDQVETLLRAAMRPICFVLLLGGLGLAISFVITYLAMPSLCPNPAFARFSPCQNYIETHLYWSTQQGNATYPDFPTLMNIESSFEKIVDGAAGGSALARAMKQSEMAVSDLSTVVRYSDLKCRESLSEKLDAFANDAKASVRALSGWGSKVGGVLDQLLSINQYSLRELNGVKEYENRKSILSIVFSAQNPILMTIYKPASYIASMSSSTPPNSPHASSSVMPTIYRHSPQTRVQIAATFNRAAEVLELNLRQLVNDGETIFTSLTHLSEQHKPIYDEIVREVVDIKKEEEVVLSSLWTKMGGNQMQRKNFRENAKLLEMIGKYEEEARGYVESTVLELDRMMADLEILRRRVAEPLLVGEGGAVNGHIGVGVGDIPLQAHIDAIEKAVERLVRKRGERREREDSYLRALIENNERGPRVDILVED